MPARRRCRPRHVGVAHPRPGPRRRTSCRRAAETRSAGRVLHRAGPSGGPITDRTDPYAAINAGFFLFQGFNAQSPHFRVQTRDMAGSIRWTGTLTAPVDGTYGIAVTTRGARRSPWTPAPVLETAEPTGEVSRQSTTVDLVAGVEHELLVEYVNDGPGRATEGSRVPARLDHRRPASSHRRRCRGGPRPGRRRPPSSWSATTPARVATSPTSTCPTVRPSSSARWLRPTPARSSCSSPGVPCRPPTGSRASRPSSTRGSVVRSRATRSPASCSATSTRPAGCRSRFPSTRTAPR